MSWTPRRLLPPGARLACRRPGRRQPVTCAALALLFPVCLAACANPNFVPPGSRPIHQVHPYPRQALEPYLAGHWRVLRRQQPPQTVYGANLLQRAAEVQNVPQWTAMSFLPSPQPPSAAHPGELLLASGSHTVRLVYWIEGNLVAIAPSAQRELDHSHWQAVADPHTLLLRSLQDGEVITLARQPAAGG